MFAEVLLRSSGYWATYVAVRKSPLYTVRSLSNVINDPFNLFTQDAWRVFRDTMIGYVTLPLLGDRRRRGRARAAAPSRA